MAEPAVLSLVAPRRPDGFVPLVAAMSAWCRPVARGQEEGRAPAAVFCTDPAAVPDTDAPLAVWVETAAEVADPGCDRADVLVTADVGFGATLDRRGLVVPAAQGDAWPGGGGTAAPAYVSPFVRTRVRQARSLAAAPVLVHDAGGWRWPGRAEPMTAELAATALSVAAVAVAVDPDAVDAALGYGVPTVTDTRCAAALQARVGSDLLAADGTDRRLALTTDILGSDPLAARLSWHGRLLFLRRHDLSRAAARLAGRLLARGDTAGHALAHVQLRLAELGTPSTATVRTRVGSALAPFARVAEGSR